MESQLGPWPRRIALLYATLVFAVWTLAITADPLASHVQDWVFVVGLPWSLLLLGGRALTSPLGLVLLFMTGILNARLLYLMAARRRYRPPSRRETPLLPPAA